MKLTLAHIILIASEGFRVVADSLEAVATRWLREHAVRALARRGEA